MWNGAEEEEEEEAYLGDRVWMCYGGVVMGNGLDGVDANSIPKFNRCVPSLTSIHPSIHISKNNAGGRHLREPDGRPRGYVLLYLDLAP